MTWPVAVVIIAVVFALMVVITTYLTSRKS